MDIRNWINKSVSDTSQKFVSETRGKEGNSGIPDKQPATCPNKFQDAAATPPDNLGKFIFAFNYCALPLYFVDLIVTEPILVSRGHEIPTLCA